MPIRSPQDKEYAANLGVRLKHARMLLDISQAALAKKSGLQIDVYAKYERGQHLMPVNVLHRISAALGASPCELMGCGCGNG